MFGSARLRVQYSLPNDVTVSLNATVSQGSPDPALTLTMEIQNQLGIYVEVARTPFGTVPPGQTRFLNVNFTQVQMQQLVGYVGNHTVRGRIILTNPSGIFDQYTNIVLFTLTPAAPPPPPPPSPPPPPPPGPTRIALVNAGFESASLAGWTAQFSGTSTVTATPGPPSPVEGLYEAQSSVIAGGNASLRQGLGSRANIYVRFYYYLSNNVFVGSNHEIASLSNGFPGTRVLFLLMAFGSRELSVEYMNAAGQYAFFPTGYIVPLGQWISIEIHRGTDPVLGKYEVWVNGALVMTLDIDTGILPTNTLVLGKTSTWQGSGDMLAFFDNVAADFAAPIGP